MKAILSSWMWVSFVFATAATLVATSPTTVEALAHHPQLTLALK